MSTTTERLFLALWPAAATRAAIERLATALGPIDGRIVPARNWHVTLVFLGAVEAARRGGMEQALASVRAEPFELVLDRVYYRRGMVWLTASDVPPALLVLVEALKGALAGCGHTVPSSGFRAHVTLARYVTRYSAPRAVTPIRWPATEFCLVLSRLDRSGSEYTEQQCWSLDGRAVSGDAGDNRAG